MIHETFYQLYQEMGRLLEALPGAILRRCHQSIRANSPCYKAKKKEQSIKTFVKRFQSMTLRCPSGMTQTALVETCRHNLQTTLLTQIGVTQSHT